MRFIGAISDTDILINLAKVNRIDILEFLFKEVEGATSFWCMMEKILCD